MPQTENPDVVTTLAARHAMAVIKELNRQHPERGPEWTEKFLGQILSETAYTRILVSAMATAMGIQIEVGPPKPELAIARLGSGSPPLTPKQRGVGHA